MGRSRAIGHCVCNPKLPCPCDLLKEQDVCLCAGEKVPLRQDGPVRLTQWVEKAGCASKIDQATLRRVVEGLVFPDDPRVLVGAVAGDDAGVFAMDEQTCLVQTVDVFSPSVDDPFIFGQIAAANSLSDVYAMGATPLTALSIVGFPSGKLADGVMSEILRGGLEKMAEAGVPVVGGHSIQDSEIKAGFAVTGAIARERVVKRAGAQPGDGLVLTKPLGTGIVCFAGQIGRASEETLRAAIASMTALNRAAAELMQRFGAHACTDVTGFGLLGHLSEMARTSSVDVELVWDSIPVLPGVVELARAGVIPGATDRNREALSAPLELEEGLDEVALELCHDPQTSGGLLIAVSGEAVGGLVAALHEAGVQDAAVIGRVAGMGEGRIAIRRMQSAGGGVRSGSKEKMPPISPIIPGSSCCEAAAAPSDDASSTPEVERKYYAFMRAANSPNGLDATTKQAIALALSVISKCEPCLIAHIEKARKLGFSEAEIDDAAWSAVAFGGSPTMMFYKGVKEKMAAGEPPGRVRPVQ